MLLYYLFYHIYLKLNICVYMYNICNFGISQLILCNVFYTNTAMDNATKSPCFKHKLSPWKL